MSLCGQSPLFVPTTVNAVIKNIDAVDVAATNLSCTNLTVGGNPVSGIWANIDSETAGTTKFTGNIEATGTVAAADFYVEDNPISGGFYLDAFHSEFENRTGQITRYMNGDGNRGTRIGNSIYYVDGDTSTHDPEAGVTNCSFKLTGPGNTVALFGDIGTNSSSGSTGTNRIGIKTTTPAYDLDVNGTTGLTGNVTAAGNITMSGTSASLTQSGTSATASLKALSCTTLAPSSTITQSGGTATLKATTVDSLTTAGNITMSGTSASLTQSGTSATASLKALSCTTLTAAGNITQSTGTVSLGHTTLKGLGVTEGYITLSYDSSQLNQTGANATASLKALSCTTFSPSSNITQTGGTASLKATTVDSLTTSGNITQSGGTASLEATTVSSLTTSGNITQSGGTTTLKATTVDSLTASSINLWSDPVYPIIGSGVTTLSTATATIQVFGFDLPNWAKRVTILAQNVGLNAGSSYGGIVPKVNDAWGTASGSGVTIEESLWGNNGASSLGGSSTIMGLWNTAGYTLGAPARTRYVIEKFDNNTWFYQVTSGTGQYVCIGQGYFTISTVQTAATTAASTNSTTITIAANNVLGVGWVVTGTGITGTVTVTAKPSSTSVTVNTAVTIANGTTLTFTAPSGELQNFRFQTVGAAIYTTGMKVRGYYE